MFLIKFFVGAFVLMACIIMAIGLFDALLFVLGVLVS